MVKYNKQLNKKFERKTVALTKCVVFPHMASFTFLDAPVRSLLDLIDTLVSGGYCQGTQIDRDIVMLIDPDYMMCHVDCWKELITEIMDELGYELVYKEGE